MVTANGEKPTKEEATAHVKELDLFVTVMPLEDTLAVLSLGILFEDHGYNYHWTSGQTPHLIKNGIKIDCNTADCVPFVVPGLSTSSSCEQNTHSNSMYRCASCVTIYTEQMITFSSREHAWLKIAVSQNNCHLRVTSRSLPHLTLTTSTISL